VKGLLSDHGMQRCSWVNNNPLMIQYHDKEWGCPLHDDRALFEFLVLEGAQAGLSWETILNKRANYRVAFESFDPASVAAYGEKEVYRLLQDSGIVRNQLKIRAAIINAGSFLEVQKEWGSFDSYLWQFVGGRPLKNHFRKISEIPAKSDRSTILSKDLQKRGFKFVGSTICYAFMQAVGMVNDHTTDCFRYLEI
jgi:DNA-3-methyladenine glycosylase I